MTLVRRSVKGSALTSAEFDGNIDDFDTRLIAIEDNPPTAVSVASFEIVGSTFYVHLTDLTVLGPYDFPEIEWNFRNDNWQPSTIYFRNDVFVENGSLYSVRLDHTSGLTFDPGDNDTRGNFYRVLFALPEAAIAEGGTKGQFYRKQSATDFDGDWQDAALEDLSDVELLTGIDIGDALIFDGTGWINGRPSLELDDLIDVVINGTSLAAGDVLKFDGADWVNDPVDLSEVTGNFNAPATALGASGTVSLDPTLGILFTVTPTNNITLNAASAPAGAVVVVRVLTSGGSSYNITPNTNFKSTGVLATGTVTAKTFTLTFIGDGTNLVEVARTTAM